MRNELRKVIESKSNPGEVYGVHYGSIRDFLDAIQSILKTRREVKDQKIRLLEQKNKAEDVIETISDYAWYHEIDNQYVKQFCIIRLVSIFEVIIDEHIPKSKQSYPLIEKVKMIKDIVDYSDLNEWIRLRREIVHRPFEHYYPVWIEWEDIEILETIITSTLKKLKLIDDTMDEPPIAQE